MYSFYLIPLFVALAWSAAVPDVVQPVEKRDACSTKPIPVVVGILKALKASPFCSSFLSIKTSTTTGTSKNEPVSRRYILMPVQFSPQR